MNEINKINLSEQTKYRLSEITETENYFHQEINQRKLCIKKSSKYVTAFDYIEKILIVLSATSGGVSIISFTNIVGAPLVIASAFYLNFFFNNRNNKKITEHSKKQKEKAW